MIRITNLQLPFDHSEQDLALKAAGILSISPELIQDLKILKRSLDARKGKPLQRVYTLCVAVADPKTILKKSRDNPRVSAAPDLSYQPLIALPKPPRQRPLIVGTGPAGIFAGLILAEAGMRPILLERGKAVAERTLDTYNFWQTGLLDPDSNAQFGEGGAGTFSDGKLQTRIKDKFNRAEKILHTLADCGAPEEILVENKPHIGTANLIKVVTQLREKIEGLGGEYRFNAHMVDLIFQDQKMAGVRLRSGEEILADIVVLAVGHSARDTYQMLSERGISLALKPFSVGVRIEHPQVLIDQNQYGKYAGHPALRAADYQLAHRSSSGRTIYSFCMCPGGTVIAAASEPGGVVTNGMSQYARNKPNANSAIVAEVYPTDFEDLPLAGIEFQRTLEQKAYRAGGANFKAPVQLLGDFLAGRMSQEIGSVIPSYQPGVKFADLGQLLPDYISSAIREALPEFDRRIAGFAGYEAVLTGLETRTSAPVRILREPDFQSISVKGLYPVGEGSGYAGGIMSSAIDGMKAAEKIIELNRSL